MYTTEQLQQELKNSQALQDAFQERLYQEVDKVTLLKFENEFLQTQLDAAIEMIATLSALTGAEITIEGAGNGHE